MTALLIRLPGNDYGLPGHYAPDEAQKVQRALDPWKSLKHYHLQPPLMLYGQVVTRWLTIPVRSALVQSGVSSRQYANEASFVLWTGRCLMAFMGALTVVAVFLLGERVASFRVGGLAALLFCVSPVAIACTHYLKEDNPLALFVALALWQVSVYVVTGRCRNAAWMGVFSALAFGSKFAGLALLVAGIAGVIQRRYATEDRSPFLKPMVWFLLSFCATAGIVFLPWMPRGLQQLRSGLTDQSKYVLKGHYDGLSISLMDHYGTFYLAKALIPALGLAAVVLMVAGCIRLVRQGRRLAINPLLVPACFSCLYWIAIEALPAKPYPFFARYLLPSVPALCVLSALGAESLAGWFTSISRQRLVFAAVSFLAIGVPGFESVRALSRVSPDTRDMIPMAIKETIPPGAWVVKTQSTYTGDFLAPGHRMVEPDGVYKGLAEAGDRDVYVVVSSFSYERYLDQPDQVVTGSMIYLALFDIGEMVKEITAEHAAFGFHNPVIRIYRVNAGEFLRRIQWYWRHEACRGAGTSRVRLS